MTVNFENGWWTWTVEKLFNRTRKNVFNQKTTNENKNNKKSTRNIAHHFYWWKIDVKLFYIENQQNSRFNALEMGYNYWKLIILTKISTTTG